MDEIAHVFHGQPGVSARPATAQAPSLATWLREGLRSALLLQPRVRGPAAAWQVAAVLLITSAVEIGVARLEVPGSAAFDVQGWLGSWWMSAACVLLAWALLPQAPGHADPRRPQGLAGWYTLWIVGTLPVVLVVSVVVALRAHDLMPAMLEQSALFAWGVFLAVWAWSFAVPVALAWRFGLRWRGLLALSAGLVAIFWVSATYFPERAWYADAPREESPRLALSQESFEKQQAVWRQSVGAIARQRPRVRDVYGLVFAPYAHEDVFLRESSMVAQLLAERFDARGRVLQLVNHATTTERLPWATPLNLQRGIEALAARMDREQDVLVLYLTSHGARDFRLAAAHWPLQVQPVSPTELRRMLDAAGIRHRVIAISACYSGGWIAPLASETSLVMSAADPDQTSYGCGRGSELTYFGRAVFDEQLRSTHSFERAFAAAVPVIRQREQEAGKPDGFSNPQISVGEKIRPVLDELAGRLAQGARH